MRRRVRRILRTFDQTTLGLMLLKYLVELALAAFIFLGPLLQQGDTGQYAALIVAAEAVAAVALVIIVCELIPRSIADRRDEEIVLFFGPAARVLVLPAMPLVLLKLQIDKLTDRLFPAPADASAAEELADEVLDVVSEGEHQDALHPSERELIRSVIAFREVDVAAIMTPRIEMVGVEASASAQQAVELMLQSGHTRLPVYDGDIDHVVGVARMQDLIREIRQDPNKPLAQIAAKPFFVPETKPVAELLREFQAGKIHFAIVVDEYGGTAGLVTHEDIVAELVGETHDEYDHRTQALMRRVDEHTVEADGRCRIDEINDALKAHLPEDAEVDTIGGFAASTLGRIPGKGEMFQHGEVVFQILDVDDRRVKMLRVQVLPEPPASDV
jgi:CBS domain containing-hemolysin-like protein